MFQQLDFDSKIIDDNEYNILYNIYNLYNILRIYFISVFGTHVRIPTPCIIIRTPYIPLDKLHSIDESELRKLTITLFIIHFMNNLF